MYWLPDDFWQHRAPERYRGAYGGGHLCIDCFFRYALEEYERQRTELRELCDRTDAVMKDLRVIHTHKIRSIMGFSTEAEARTTLEKGDEAIMCAVCERKRQDDEQRLAEACAATKELIASGWTLPAEAEAKGRDAG